MQQMQKLTASSSGGDILGPKPQQREFFPSSSIAPLKFRLLAGPVRLLGTLEQIWQLRLQGIFYFL
jgi:hypothetical protein